MRMRRWQPAAIAMIAIVLVLALTTSGRAVWEDFFGSLRIAKPKPVTVTIPGFSGPTATRRLQDAIGGMIADTTSVTLDEQDRAVPNADSAARLAGLTAQLPHTRTDQPTFIVVGARSVAMSLNRSQLLTTFREAGMPSVAVPADLNGARIAIRTPRAIRVQYGHCPVDNANTLQGQLQGPPPPSTDNGDCVVLIESPPTAADLPSGLDMQQLTAIGLELSGMSPDQTQAFQKAFSWQSALSMSMPRFMRSYDSVTVNGVPGMLLNTAGRRGPTYELFWVKNAVVFSLAGYGSSADAVPLANSTH